MAQVKGLSIKQLDKRADRFVATIETELRAIARKTAAGIGEVTVADARPGAVSVADLNKIRALWESVVDGQLLSILAAVLFSSSGAVADSINRVVGRPISTPIGEDTVVELAMKQARNQLVNIGDDYWSEARDSLTEGLQEGESIDKLSARVQDAVEVTRPRAEVIARTEVMRASNQGSIMTMRAAELITTKSWLATPDARTRSSHRAANGQTVPLDDPFVIGGEVDDEGNVVVEGAKLDHPGDPLGPPSETIQCRCTMLYEVEELEPLDDDEPEPLAADGADTPRGDTLSAETSFKADGMPWYIEKGHEGCGGDTPWAVVKQDSDEVEGCHATKEEALDQMAALYANEDEDMATEEQQCPPGTEWDDDAGECVKVDEAAASKTLAADEDGECPPGHHKMPDGECMPDDEMEDSNSNEVRATGIATREGEWTGDGRMFADGSLDWPDPAKTSIPLQWQKETSHGGMNDVTVNIGWLTALERGDNGQIGFEAVIDTDSADGLEAARFVAKRGQFGVSIVADDPEKAEMEFVYPEECNEGKIDEESDIDEMPMSCFMPDVIFHSGRIRALTLVDVPAFADAYIEISDADALTASTQTLGAVGSHDTATSDSDWDAAAQEGKLDSPMGLDTARSMYAWIDETQAEGDEVTKAACKFPHHEVNEDGTPGAANLAACSAGIGALNGARSEPDIPAEDFQGVYDHLAAHLRDADQEPPEAEFETKGALVASYSIEIPDLPPAEWYNEPTELPEIGAIKVTDEGRFYGLLAPRGVAHRSFGDRKVTVPMGNVDYSRWMNRETLVAGGKRIVAGPVTMECGHASVHPSVSAQASRDHYDNSCSVVATVRIGENRDGVWVAGALLPGVDAKQIAKMMACQLSGDWRPHPDKPGKREMCGALLVPVPGFPKANKSTASVVIDNGQLVAATAPVSWESSTFEPEPVEWPATDDQTAASNDSDELDLPTWEEVQARKDNSSKVADLAKQLGIEV